MIDLTKLLGWADELDNDRGIGAGDDLRDIYAQACANRTAAETLSRICDLLHIGSLARTPSTILVNIENVIRRRSCLDAIEREFFTMEATDEEGESYYDCMLKWGSESDEYVEQFRDALKIVMQAHLPDGWKLVPKVMLKDAQA
jgi:hypothetical protein